MFNFINIILLLIVLLCIKYLFFYTNNIDNFQIITNPNINIQFQQEFYDKSIFPELDLINNSIIKKELIQYIHTINNWTEWPEHELWKNNNTNLNSNSNSNTNSNISWTIIPLIAFGKLCEKNAKLFPNTLNQLKKIPNLITAGFSKLGPGTKLSYHKGWAKLSNNVLRCHLGLIVPENKCMIMVTRNNNYSNLSNIKAMYQQENKWIIFDDSLYHSASNNSESYRIVLILDIKRPTNIMTGTSNIEYSEELDNFMNEFI